MTSGHRITLKEKKLKQLRDILEEKNHSGSIALREAPKIPEGYVEEILLDTEGEQTNAKRVLFKED